MCPVIAPIARGRRHPCRCHHLHPAAEGQAPYSRNVTAKGREKDRTPRATKLDRPGGARNDERQTREVQTPRDLKAFADATMKKEPTKTAVEMTFLWKPQNGFHRNLQISHTTRDSHIPTAVHVLLLERKKERRTPIANTTAATRRHFNHRRRSVAASATFRTGKNRCRQPAKVLDVDHRALGAAHRRRKRWTPATRLSP